MKNPHLYSRAVAFPLLAGLLIVTALAQTPNAPPPGGPPGGGPGGRGGRGGGPGGMLATQMLVQGDKNADQKLTPDELGALADAWFDKLDTDKSGRLTQAQFAAKFGDLLPSQIPPGGGQPGGGPPGGGRGPGGPGGFIGGALFAATDGDKDGALTRAEFKTAFQKWAADFDSDKTGSLDQAKLVAGLNGVMPRPSFGPRAPTADDNAGFTAIFDGKSLEGWDGDPKIWRVENGEIIGESTEANPIKVNTFLIWRAGTTKDFEFKIGFKLSDGANSGVQYRSSVVTDAGPWTMKGYQADMDSANQFTGMIYEERGRGFLAPRGQFTRVLGRDQTRLIGTVGESDALKAFIKQGDWNQLHIIARGGELIQIVNGHVMSGLLDEDESGRTLEGLLGLQIHVGPPMKLQFRNVLFKKL